MPLCVAILSNFIRGQNFEFLCENAAFTNVSNNLNLFQPSEVAHTADLQFKVFSHVSTRKWSDFNAVKAAAMVVSSEGI